MLLSVLRMKSYWILGLISAGMFTALLLIRPGFFHDALDSKRDSSFSGILLSEKETWMNIFQDNRKIGFSQTAVKRANQGYHLEQFLDITVNTMGLIQEIHMKTRGILRQDLSIESFEMEMNSGRFSFFASGKISGNLMDITVQGSGGNRKFQIPLKTRPYLPSGVFHATVAQGLAPGEEKRFPIFDLTTMEEIPAVVKVLGKEDIMNMGVTKAATKVILAYKGASQSAWIDEDGEVLREEGFLGMRLEKTNRSDALSGIAATPSRDLIQAAAVTPEGNIKNILERNELLVELSGIALDELKLDGGRQKISGNRLSIAREDLKRFPSAMSVFPERDGRFAPYLAPTPFIQSNHKTIKDLSQKITSAEQNPIIKIRKIAQWIHMNIEKKPVLSIPDALSTLALRMGDCNEHAMLFAALARASGIPTAVEAGLVFLNGRFYYHAWNLSFAGEWITVDSLFNQIPADVTHIRFVSRADGSPVDLLGIMGKIRIKIPDQE